ncbi:MULTISPECIES: hypothetical protein [Citrobacter]|uniref:hypothetical protein n=1 Tax=Citrobacter TaxID=544 RepID=UPI00168127EB|nr:MULTISPECIES: hypothetical protein [Citrobacter]MCK7561602.1 hypothetical protein [Citrobacter koseri]MDM2952792.1 hypothetical protein [Citrobacter sp. CK203]MDM3032025.1 hypothetical protein [Citrobacter sp. CK186]
MSQVTVKAAPGVMVPREDNPRRYITGEEPVTVEYTVYYQRQVMAGDLLIVGDKKSKGGKATTTKDSSPEVNDGQS